MSGSSSAAKAVGESIGRVAEDQVEALARRGAGSAARRRARPRARSLEPELARRCAARSGRARVDERRAPRAPRESASIAERAVPQKRSSTRGARDVAEDREERLAHAVGGRPHGRRAPRRRREPPAPELARRRPASGSRRDRLGPLVAEAPRAPRPAAARAPGASSEPCRSRSSIDLARAPRAAAPCPRAASATRNRGRPCCRVPRISPSPRSARSTSASLKPSRSLAIASSRALRELGLRVARRGCSSDSCSPRPTRPRSWWSCESP